MPGALDGLRFTAASLVARFGKTLTLRRLVGAGYNPSSGAPAAATATEVSVVGFVDRFTPAEVAAGVAEAPDVKVVLAAEGLGIEPRKGDELLMGGAGSQKLQVVGDPVRVYSGAEVALYELRARG